MSGYVQRNHFDPKRWALDIGEATQVLLNSDRKRLSIATIGAFIIPFAKLRQIKIFYGYNGTPSAYLTWGYLSEPVLAELMADPQALIDIEDLNGGDNLVFFDVLSNLNDPGPIWNWVREMAAPGDRSFYGVRESKGGRSVDIRRYEMRGGRCRWASAFSKP